MSGGKRRSQSSAANGNPLILWHLGESGARRFLQLQRLIPGITRKMLTQRLREPERDGILAHKIFNEMPPHVEYSLTKYASTLRPLLPAVDDRGADPVPRLAQRRVGQPDEEQPDQAVLDVGLYLDRMSLHPDQGHRVGAGQRHQPTPRTCSMVKPSA